MKVRVKRFGGQLPQLQPERELDLAALDADEEAAIDKLLKAKRHSDAPVPDGYSYRFDVEQDDGTSRSVTVPESAVPRKLLKHLP
jgi:hypothetical protein